MKTRLFFVLTLIAVVTTACKLDGESNYTPDLGFYSKPVANHNDSLSILITDECYVLDTLEVGDTVQFRMFANGYGNNLKQFYIKQSADSSITLIFPEDKNALFLPASDYKNGLFLMDGTFSGLYFAFQMVAKKPNLNTTITFSVTSDANFKDGYGSNSNSFKLKTPIVAVPDTIE